MQLMMAVVHIDSKETNCFHGALEEKCTGAAVNLNPGALSDVIVEAPEDGEEGIETEEGSILMSMTNIHLLMAFVKVGKLANPLSSRLSWMGD